MRNTFLLKSISSLKRITCALLVFCALAALTGCKSKEPKLVDYTDNVGGFSFSYPETWEIYSENGKAYIDIADVGGALPYAIVRFNAFDNAEKLTAAEYWNNGVEGFSTVYDSYSILQDKRGVFEKDGVDSAYYAVVEVKMKGETKLDGQPSKAGEAADYTIHQLVFEGGGRLCVVSYMSSKENYGIYSTVMDDIKESFAFVEVGGGDSSVTDKNVADFTVPVPEGWVLDAAEAYYQMSCGKASIIACVYSMDQTISPKKYWETIYRGSVQSGLDGFKELDTKECKMGGIDALDVYYTGNSASGNTYHFRQCIAVKQGQAYIITLTASEADYKSACTGFEAAVKGFSFK